MSETRVFQPSATPLVDAPVSSLLEQFDPHLYKLDSSSHIRRMVETVCGPAGLGGLLADTIDLYLSQGLNTAFLTTVDWLFSSVMGFQRVPWDTLDFDVRTAFLTLSQAEDYEVRAADYKRRYLLLLQGLDEGNTPQGVRDVCEAILGTEVSVVEQWRSQPGSWRLQVQPWEPVTAVARRVCVETVQRLKPSDTVVTITEPLHTVETFPPSMVHPLTVGWRVKPFITNHVDNQRVSVREPLVYGYNAFTNASQNGTYEAPIQYGERQQTPTIQYPASSVTASVSVIDDGVESSVAPWSDKTKTIQWGNWITYQKADSPDNYPGGMNGVHPLSAPAITPAGTPYLFPYQSQAEYETQEAERIMAQGGQTRPGEYRLPLSETQNTITYSPDKSLRNITNPFNSLKRRRLA